MSMTESTSLKNIYTCHISKRKKKEEYKHFVEKSGTKKKNPKDFDNTTTHSRIHASDSYSIYAFSVYWDISLKMNKS